MAWLACALVIGVTWVCGDWVAIAIGSGKSDWMVCSAGWVGDSCGIAPVGWSGVSCGVGPIGCGADGCIGLSFISFYDSISD